MRWTVIHWYETRWSVSQSLVLGGQSVTGTRWTIIHWYEMVSQSVSLWYEVVSQSVSRWYEVVSQLLV